MGYENCRKKNNECSGDELFEKSMVGVRFIDRVTNEEVHSRVVKWVIHRLLRFFGHVERMEDNRMARSLNIMFIIIFLLGNSFPSSGSSDPGELVSPSYR